LQRAQFELHFLAQLFIERSQWLIPEQYFWSPDQCAGESHPLSLSTGQFVGSALAETLELDHLQHLADPSSGFGSVEPLGAQTIRNVAARIEMRN